LLSGLLLSCIVGLSSVCAETTTGSEKIHVVVGEGSAPLAEYTMDKARRIAVSKALSDGVVQSVAVLISPEQAAKFDAELQAHILSRANHYVRDYCIIRENEEHGRYSVHVQATIDQFKLQADLSSLGLLGGSSSGPLTLLMLVERDESSETARYWWDVSRPVEAVLTDSFRWFEESLAQRGFRMIAGEEALKKGRQRGPALPPDISDEDAAEMGKAFEADIVILSHSEARRIAGKACRVMMWSRGIAVDSRKPLAQAEGEQVVESEDLDQACEKAFHRCGLQIMDSLQNIASSWGSAHPDAITIEITLKGVPNYLYFLDIQKELTGRIAGMQFTDSFSIEAGIYHTKVRFNGSIHHLAQSLGSEIYGEFELEVEETKDTSLVLYVRMPDAVIRP